MADISIILIIGDRSIRYPTAPAISDSNKVAFAYDTNVFPLVFPALYLLLNPNAKKAAAEAK